MEIKNGYKQTEVGVIPVDWEIKDLYQVAKFINGKAHEMFIDENGDYKVVNSKFVSSEGSVYKFSSKSLCNLNVGDITMVMSDIPNGKALAKCFLIDQNNTYTLNQRICALTPFEDSPNYLFRALNRNKYFLAFDSGTGQTNLRRQEVLSCPVILPSKSEQVAIANTLSDTDAYITSLENLIEKKRQIKQGVMQELLKPIDGWETKKLGDFLEYEQPGNYIVKSTKYNDNYQIPVLTAGKSFVLGYTDEEFGIFRDVPVIIFDDFTTAIKYVDFNFKVKSSAMKILRPKNQDTNLRFVYEMMQTIEYPMGVGDHKRHWIASYQFIEIKVPSIEVQNQISSILMDMDDEIINLTHKLKKVILTKQGMMQNLLTGKIRLI
jgi:type I restriction enzyme S subunit